MRQHAGEIFDEARAGRAGEGAGLLHVPPKLVCALCQPESLELLGVPRVCANQHEVAEVGYQHQPILFPVAADLGSVSRQPRHRRSVDLTSITPRSGGCPSRGRPFCICFAA